MKDLGVNVEENLSFSDHIADKINKAYQIINIINRTFEDIDKVTFFLLYKCMIRSHLEFAHSVWSPYKVGVIHDIEKVQKRATKLVRGCQKLSYQQRLKFLKLPTMKYRRSRGDMIEVYKILHDYYEEQVASTLSLSTANRTTGCLKKRDPYNNVNTLSTKVPIHSPFGALLGLPI